MPKAHGSALFTRGETQALVVTTLGAVRDAQLIEGLDGSKKDPFMLHYNFPPFSVGETGFMSGPKRREIGHGRLARRGVAAVMPSEEDFPMRFEWFLKSPNPTVPAPWPAFVAAACQ